MSRPTTARDTLSPVPGLLAGLVLILLAVGHRAGINTCIASLRAVQISSPIATGATRCSCSASRNDPRCATCSIPKSATSSPRTGAVQRIRPIWKTR
jgi:hypothetical protein